MKLRFLPISAISLLLLAFMAMPAHAKMMYYTFKGTYTSESFDFVHSGADRSSIPNELYRSGSDAFYTYGFDPSRQGLVGPYRGGLLELEGSQYVEYAGGSALTGYNKYIDGIIENVYHPNMQVFTASSNGNRLKNVIQSLEIGGQLWVTEHYYTGDSLTSPGPNDLFAMVTAQAQLVSISSVNPYATAATPIPGAFWLLGTGLVGVLGLRKKFK